MNRYRYLVLVFLLAWHACGICVTTLESSKKPIVSFETNNPFEGGTLVSEPALGGKALRIDNSFVAWQGAQDWTGYDFLKMDLYSNTREPVNINIEINDNETQGYWTRVNYSTIVPPGKSTLVLPVKQFYVGEKARPGRMLNLNTITKFVINIGDSPKEPVLLGKIWLENDKLADTSQFDGLRAFDFGTETSPLMEGFTRVSPSTRYSKGLGYGLHNAKVWRALDSRQPDPLYQDYLCIESGGFAVDVPNGTYRVFVNIDNPSGYWGEFQFYRQRSILAQGKEVVHDTMDFNALKDKYFRYWNTEDLPTDNTFDKYQKPYFHEKTFDVDVTDGQLKIDFQGENFACSVSTIIIYPVSKASDGERFLKWVENKRRFHFDNYFKRSIHTPTGDPIHPSESEQKQGYIVFQRDIMKDVHTNDTPFNVEIGQPLKADSFADQRESITLSLLPLRDLGMVSIQASELTGSAGTIPASAIETGYVSNRISRVSADGTIYNIFPRIIMPGSEIAISKDIARRFWLTIKTPADAKPGVYKGNITIQTAGGNASSIPVELRVRKGTLDPVDIPAGPFGYTIDTPWFDDDEAVLSLNHELAMKSLLKMREYGFTMFSGVPTILYKGFENGQPVLDFGKADTEMKLAKDLGFLAVSAYGAGLSGLTMYSQDTEQMKKAGFSDYSAFIKTIFTAIQKHADEHKWLPVYWNLADEPDGDNLLRSIENAEAYRNAFPKGPLLFSGATSFKGSDQNAPRFKLSKAFHVANLTDHDEEAVNLLHKSGTDWAFYNGGNRWTYGEYLYKAARQFGAKFRISWHWNLSAGNPYYALDCREDDNAWCHATPDAQLTREVGFERIAAGLVDYRMLLTLQRLAKEKKGTHAANAAEKLIISRLSAFKLGQQEHDEVYSADDWTAFRQKMADAIEALRK